MKLGRKDEQAEPQDDLSWLPPDPVTYYKEWQTMDPRPPMSSGLKDVDRILEGGFRGGEVITVAGQTGGGKSVFGLTVARHLAEAGNNVMFFTYEMTIAALRARLCQQLTRIPAKRILSKNTEGEYALTQKELTIADEGFQHINSLPLYIDGGRYLSVENMAYKMEKLVEHRGIDIFIFDYIQTMSSYAENKAAKIAELMREISSVAKEIVDKPMLCLAQINRNVPEPTIYDIKDSHSICQESDVCGVLKPLTEINEGRPTPVELSIEKNRSGMAGVSSLIFHPDTVEFTDA